MTRPAVHIVDDDPNLYRAMSRLLRTCNCRVQNYSSVSQFLSQRLSPKPACLVLDLKMAEISGLDVQKILSHGDGCLPVIFVSGRADIEASVRAMKAGAIDFLTKPFEYRQLASAIDTALTLSEQNLVKRDKLRKDQEAFVSLTPRERDVCIRIAQGLMNKQVGFELGTKEKTVKQQRARVMQKLGAASLPDVVRFIDRLRIAGTIPESHHQSHL